MARNVNDILYGLNTKDVRVKKGWKPSTGSYPPASEGWLYIAEDDGTVGGKAFKIDDKILRYNNRWIPVGTVGGVDTVNTDSLTEGTVNLFFTTERARNAQVQPNWEASSGKGAIANKPLLGSAAGRNANDFATAVQGGKADSAVQPEDIVDLASEGYVNQVVDSLAEVAHSGDYQDLQNKPTIPIPPSSTDQLSEGLSHLYFTEARARTAQLQPNWNAVSGKAAIANKPTIPSSADEIEFDPTGTTITAGDLQGAVEELASRPIADNTVWSMVNHTQSPIIVGTTKHGYIADTRVDSIVFTLPETPAVNQTIYVVPFAPTFHLKPVTLSRNGSKIMGVDEDLTVNTVGQGVALMYLNSTIGWTVRSY